jgi:hypothetical protein
MTEQSKNPQLRIGDKFQNGVMIQGGEILWGSIQTVKRLSSEGNPIFRAKWGKINKIAEYWRLP